MTFKKKKIPSAATLGISKSNQIKNESRQAIQYEVVKLYCTISYLENQLKGMVQ